MKDALNGPNSVVSAQQIVEREAIEDRLSKLGGDMAGIGAECDKLAKGLDDFADNVQHTQNAIRDLLHRLGSPSGLWHELVEVFEGHGLDEVKKIANDIKAVLHGLMGQAQAREQMLQQGMQKLDGLVRALEIYVRAEITHYVGEDIGNPLATAFDTYVNVGEGVFKGAVGMAEGLEQLNPLRFTYDPEGAAATWKGMTKGSVINSFLNPEEAVQANKDIVKGLLHLDDWSRDRPGLGAGENLFDITTLFAPGLGGAGAATKGAEAAGAAGRAADAADAAGAAGRGGRALGEAGEVTRATGSLSDIGKTTSGLTKDLENIRTDLPKSDPPPGGRPGGLPPPKPADAPIGPTPRPVESTPPLSPRPPTDQPTTPVPGSPERATAPSPNAQSLPATTAPGELAPTNPQLAGAPPGRVPVPPGGFPAAHPDGGYPPEPSPPHDPGGPGGGDGHDGSADHGGPYGSDHGDTASAYLTDQKRDEILAMEKGTRPDPTEYLTPEFIEHHPDQFNQGGTRFMLKDTFADFGIGQVDGTTFVFPTSEIDALMEATKGDPAALEKALGLPDGYFKDNVIRVDIRDVGHYNLRIPSGNEAGANAKWLPGGLLPQGMPEAVIDGSKVPLERLTVDDHPDTGGK